MNPRSSAARNVRLFYAYGFCSEFALWAGVWIQYLIDVRGLELKWILAMDLPFWLGVAVLQVPMGALADHIGRRKVMALGAITFAFTVLGFGFTQNYWMLFADYMLWSVALSLQSGADQAFLYDSLKEAGEEHHFQRLAGRGFAIRLGSNFFGILLGGFIGAHFGLAAAVQLGAIPPLLACGVSFFMLEPKVLAVERHYWRGLRDGVSFAWSAPQVRYTLLIGSVLLAGTFGPVVLVQPFLAEHNVGTALFGVYQAPLRLISAAAALLVFRVTQRAGTGPLLIGLTGIMVVSYLGLSTVQSTAAFGFFGLTSLISGVTHPALDSYVNDRTPSERRATVLSVMQLCFALQAAFFEPALGFFADDVSLAAAFAFAAAYFLVLMPPLLALWLRAQRRGRSPPAVGVPAPGPAPAGG